MSVAARDRNVRLLLISVFVVHAVLVGFVLSNDSVSHQDENYYFATTRAMLATGDYLVPVYEGEPRIKKPILFYWLMLPSQAIFGPGFWSGRLISVLSSLGLLCLTWRISGLTFSDPARRVATVWMFASADIVFRYSHYAVPEITLTLALTTAHLAFLRYDQERVKGKRGTVALAAFYAAMGAAFMIKGPVGIVLPLGTGVIAYLVQGRAREIRGLFSLVGVATMLLITAPWYLLIIHRFGAPRVLEMISAETAGRIGISISTIFFFVPVTLGYFLPWTLVLLGRVPDLFRWKKTRPAPYRPVTISGMDSTPDRSLDSACQVG